MLSLLRFSHLAGALSSLSALLLAPGRRRRVAHTREDDHMHAVATLLMLRLQTAGVMGIDGPLLLVLLVRGRWGLY